MSDFTCLCVCGNNMLGGNLYIIMEYIEGSSLLQLCNSLKEKKQSFSEERIWKMFTQVLLLLLYHVTMDTGTAATSIKVYS